MRYGSVSERNDGFYFNQELQRQKWHRKRSLLILALAVALMLGMSIILVSIPAQKASDSTKTETSEHIDPNEHDPPSNNTSDESIYPSLALNFTLKRQSYPPLEYFGSTADSLTKYAFLEGYSAVIEPMADMELVLDSQYDSVNFTVCPTDKLQDCQQGYSLKKPHEKIAYRTINFNCRPHDTYIVSVNAQNFHSGEVIPIAQGMAICLYVRREIRSLTDDDLDKFLDASRALSDISEEDGQSLYGSNYHSNSYLLKFHYFNAAWQDADHFHEGNGFLAQHCKITNIFELALQSLDPSVVVPYWDFTIDSAQGATSLDAFVVGPEMYGSVQMPQNQAGFTYGKDSVLEGRLVGGRWNNVTAEMNTHYPELSSGYGYLRSPWNLNPSPYVSRYTLLRGRPEGQTPFPSCSAHFDLLQVNSMMDFFFDMQLLPHGAVHIEFGGAYGCEILQPLLEAGYILDEESMWGVCRKWFIILKEGYRANYFVPKSNCQVAASDPTDSYCPLQCTETSRDSYYSLFRKVMSADIDAAKADAEAVWYDFICTNGSKIFTGDHLESASTGDPSFWVIHPTLERLLQAKFMTGGFFDESWPASTGQGFVCNKAQCYSPETGTKDFHADCCYGHYENDQMFDAVSGSRDVKVGPTNREVLDATDPRKSTYSMPYIYDSFRWPHCVDQGLDFDALLEQMAAAYQNYASSGGTAIGNTGRGGRGGGGGGGKGGATDTGTGTGGGGGGGVRGSGASSESIASITDHQIAIQEKKQERIDENNSQP